MRTSTKTKISQFAETVKSLLLGVLKYWVQKRNVIIESPFLHLFKFLIVKLSLLLKVLTTFVSAALKNLKHNFESWFYLFSQGLQRWYRRCYEKSSSRGIFLQLGDAVYTSQNFNVLTYCKFEVFRRSHRRSSIEKGVVRNFTKFTGKQSLLLIKL